MNTLALIDAPQLPMWSMLFACLVVGALLTLGILKRNISWIWALVIIVAFIGLGVIPVKLKWKDFEASFKNVRQTAETLQKENDALKQRDALRTALQRIVDARRNDWRGTFEREYANVTLFITTPLGTSAPPLKVYDLILQWRGGLSSASNQSLLTFLSGTGLAGGKALTTEEVAKNFGTYVESVGREIHLLDMPEAKKILILGEPASGKSTMLLYNQLVAARRALTTVTPTSIPVLITLSEKLARPEDLTVKVKAFLTSQGIDVAALDNGHLKVVLLLDALDEAPDINMAAKGVAELSAQPWVERSLVTCRIVNYVDQLFQKPSDLGESGFRTVFLYGNGLDAIERRVALSARLDPERKAKLLALLADPNKRDEWLQFLRLPSNFNLIVDVFLGQEGPMPPRPWNLFEEFFDARLKMKVIDPAMQVAVPQILDAQARKLISQGIENRDRPFTASDARDALAQASPTFSKITIANAETFLDAAAKAPFLTKLGNGTYRFHHLQFLDFCVARTIDTADAVPVDNVNWQQIVLFRVGRDDGVSAALLERVVDHADKVQNESSVRFAISCIDAANPTPERSLTRAKLQARISPLTQASGRTP
jgi:hypothetical protein